MSRTNSTLLPLFAVNFVGTLGVSIVLPFLVYVVTAWGGNAFVYGLMGATYSSFQLLGAPILGRWSDRIGRRKVLLVSQGGTLLSWCLLFGAFSLPSTPLIRVEGSPLGAFALTLPLVVMFVARALDGLTGGNVSVANAYVADITNDADRNANFGRMALSANLGFIVGPALAGLLGGTAWGERLPVLGAILISATALAIIGWRLPESRPAILRTDPSMELPARAHGEHKACVHLDRSLATTTNLREALRIPCMARLLTVHFLVMLAFNFFYAVFPMHAARGLGWPVRQTGAYLAVLSLLMVLAQGPLLRWASRRFDEGSLVLFGGIVLALGFPFFSSASWGWLLVAASGMALGNGLMWPSLLSWISKAAGSRDQGVIQGYAGSGGALASIIGLLIGGALFTGIGTRVFWISAGVFGIAAMVAASLGSSLGFLRSSRNS